MSYRGPVTYRVIQWATGNVGKSAIEGVLAHPELELVGVKVYGSDKDGVDAGEICGIDPIGVAATIDDDAVLALDADCVVYTPVLANRDEVRSILASGKNVVTPVGWLYPFVADRVLGHVEDEPILRAAIDGGVTLHGTGIHPGGITERFPLMVSALVSDVRHVRAEEFSDIRSYAAEFVVREIMMFGKSPEETATSSMSSLMGGHFGESISMLAAELGFDLDADIQADHQWAVATAPIDSPVGVIDPGTVAAQRFTWTATVDGEAVITVAVNWLMGEEHLDPPWTFGDGQRFEVSVAGNPSLDVTFRGLQPAKPEDGLVRNPGIVATAMHCVNAVPYVCEAAPGIASYLDLPLIAGRAAR